MVGTGDDGASGGLSEDFVTPDRVAGEAEALYLDLIGSDGVPLRDLDDRAADVVALLEAGLAQERAGSLVAVPVRLAVEHWAAAQQGRIQSARVAAQHYAATQRARGGGYVEVLRGVQQAREVFEQVQRAAREELLCFDREPHFSDTRGEISPVQDSVSSSGVHYRVVYHPGVLSDPVTREIVRVSMDLGEEARVFSVPLRMVVADRTMAAIFLPYGRAADGVGPGDIDAVLVHPSALLDALVALFHMVWDLAVPLGDLGADPTAEPRRVMQLLALGMTDGAIARQLGVSERTVHRRVTRLQEMLGAPNRCALGVQAAKQGWV